MYYALIRGACTSLGIQSHYQVWMIDVPIQCKSTVTVQQQGVSQEDVELEDV